MTQPLNYCRSLLLQIEAKLVRAEADEINRVRILAERSQKFILPEGGLLLDDSQLRGLDESMLLSLPHEVIALEYQGRAKAEQKRKGDIVFAQQLDTEICLMLASRLDDRRGGFEWTVWGDRFYIPRSDYIDRTIQGERGFPGLRLRDSNREAGSQWLDPDENYGIQRTLLSFLNALACSNVRVETIEPRRKGKVKSALPFDTYKVLVGDVPRRAVSAGIGPTGSHRSPREHLRRGHIRRLESGLRVWVNATVVNPGTPGKVVKDYAVRGGHGT